MVELTDQAFTGVRPLLAADRRRGRPCRDHRQVLGGIIWKLHTDRPWRDVPERFGPWQTCYGRLRRWQRDGTWPRIWAVLAASEHDSGHDRRDQAAAPVAVAGAGLMTATPPRPPQHLADRGRRPPHQPDSSRRASAVEIPTRSDLGDLGGWAVLRAQPPPTPTRRPLAAWARTAARNA